MAKVKDTIQTKKHLASTTYKFSHHHEEQNQAEILLRGELVIDNECQVLIDNY